MSEKAKRGRPKAFNDKTAQNTIQSLDRALVVLDAVAVKQGQTLTELSKTLDQSPATVYRVLATLASHQMVETDPAQQTWNIGAAAFRIGSAFLRRTSLVERARPLMNALMEATGETANLGIERGGKVMFLAQAETHESIRAFFPPGTLAPMHTSGIGKAILAQYAPDAVAAVFKSEAEKRFTPFSLNTLDRLAADLKVTKSRGFSVDNEEKTLGMRCIAAPVFGADGQAIAGLSISGPISRVTSDKVLQFGQEVAHKAMQLSEAIGGARQKSDI